MRKVKKLTALLLVMAMVITCFAGCGKSNSNSGSDDKTKDSGSDTTATKKEEVQKVNLKVWAPQEDQKKIEGKTEKGVIKDLCEQFNEAHPEWDITFTYGVCAEGDALKNLKKDAAAGGDVFLYTTDQLAGLVEAGILNPLAPTAEDEMKKDLEDAAIQSVKSGDNLYGYPYTANSWFMYYNKSMYTEDEVKSLDTMLAKDFGKGVYNLAFDIDNAWYSSAFWFANGCTLFGADGQDANSCDFNNDKGVEVGNYMLDAYKTNKIFDITNNNELKLLKSGKIAASCSGTWSANDYKKALGDNYAAVKLPTAKIGGKDVQLSNFNSYKVVGVNSQTKYPKVALALAEYLGGSEAQKLRLDAQSVAPINKTVMAEAGDSIDEAVKALNEQIKYSTLQPGISQMNNFWTPVQAFGAGIKDGSVKADNMQAKLDEMVKGVLATLKQ